MRDEYKQKKNINKKLEKILRMNESNRFDFDDIIEHLEIQSDEFRLNQIMLNLISNAVKFTNNGNIIIITNIVYILDNLPIYLNIN